MTPGIENHVKELLNDYQRKDADFLSFHQERKHDKAGKCVSHFLLITFPTIIIGFVSGGAGADASMDMAMEEYEKSRPLHGDKMFHYFVSKIKTNPEQILR